MFLIFAKSSFVMLLAIATTRALAAVGDQHTLSISHIMAPISNVPLLFMIVKMFSLPMSLIMHPITDVKFLVIVKTLTIFALSKITFPIARKLISRLFLLICTYISTPSVSLIEVIDMPFVDITIGVMYLDYLLFYFIRLTLIAQTLSRGRVIKTSSSLQLGAAKSFVQGWLSRDY